MTAANQPAAAVPVGSDEQISSVMIYTSDQLIWGEVVTKVSLRVSNWLRTQAIPQFIQIFNAHTIRLSATGATRPQAYSNLLLPSNQVLAFHLRPPTSDPLDYDPKEPMRKMAPTLAMVGLFNFTGTIRMSTHTDLRRYLEVTKESFVGMYDIAITTPVASNLGPIHIPFALLREGGVIFSSLEQPDTSGGS
ncbi:MAG: hypothetical protein ACKOC5_09985 [Chloroflexota bacterium]